MSSTRARSSASWWILAAMERARLSRIIPAAYPDTHLRLRGTSVRSGRLLLAAYRAKRRRIALIVVFGPNPVRVAADLRQARFLRQSIEVFAADLLAPNIEMRA